MSVLLQQYINSISIMNKQTANEYYTHLSNFQKFLVSHYGNGINLDNFVEDLKINLVVQVIIIH